MLNELVILEQFCSSLEEKNESVTGSISDWSEKVFQQLDRIRLNRVRLFIDQSDAEIQHLLFHYYRVANLIDKRIFSVGRSEDIIGAFSKIEITLCDSLDFFRENYCRLHDFDIPLPPFYRRRWQDQHRERATKLVSLLNCGHHGGERETLVDYLKSAFENEGCYLKTFHDLIYLSRLFDSIE